MEKPRLIEFKNDSLVILQKTLIAVSPQEGCALLIGDQKESRPHSKGNNWRIHLVWPCMNIWEPGIFNFQELSNSLNIEYKTESSKRTRFALDPREQIHAQRWARSLKLKILGTAHSHPTGEASPSSVDIAWNFSSKLMVILGKSGRVRAWWIAKSPNFLPQEVVFLKH